MSTTSAAVAPQLGRHCAFAAIATIGHLSVSTREVERSDFAWLLTQVNSPLEALLEQSMEAPSVWAPVLSMLLHRYNAPYFPACFPMPKC
jgi:hypothetical protein